MRVILAGGGTGGHIFPALALAQEFVERDKDNTVLFVGSKKGLDEAILSKYGFCLQVVDLEGLKGKGTKQKFISLIKAARGFFSALSIIRSFKPDLVVGVGGYSSGPVVMSAALMRVKTVVLEQNLLPGLTNRILSHCADRIFTSFEESYAYFPKGKTMFAGNPVRKDILSLFRGHDGGLKERENFSGQGAGDVKEEAAGERKKFTILVLGGSQGSHQINVVITKVMEYLSDIKERIRVVHQSGRNDLDLLREAYREKGFSCEVTDFIDDIGEAYRKSDLVICRGGATTLSELLISGKASIIMPYPYAADNHQEMNARALESKGAAIVMGVGGIKEEELALSIKDFFNNPQKIKDMETKVSKMAKPDATKTIVDNCYNLIGEN
jgi:UDP-N-acetylglucosamine--N-acetylmuramyl-(pentapeptide) pyrophosphoryl-undecaprenol N-acetylglucosamine transferase